VIDIWGDSDRTVTFFKGRVALYAILRAAGIGLDDEVLLPGFTCVVVPAAVIYTGATPTFYDINPRQLNGDPDDAVNRITEHTRAIIVQHTFGVPADLGRLKEVCKERGILLIEDCAHAMGATLDGQQVGTLGDAAFASLQWSKLVTTGLGGIARANDDSLYERLCSFHDEECADPPWQEEAFLNLACTMHSKFFRPSMFWALQSLYRTVGSIGLVRGSSDQCELSSPNIPPRHAMRFGKRRRSRLTATLRMLPQVIEHRRSIADIYKTQLRSWNIDLQEEQRGAVSVPLRVPIRVRDRSALLEEARRERIELGDWFNAPLHPVEAPQAMFGYGAGDCPHAERAAVELLNLPTHPGVDADAAEGVLEFLGKHRHQLLPTQPNIRA